MGNDVNTPEDRLQKQKVAGAKFENEHVRNGETQL